MPHDHDHHHNKPLSDTDLRVKALESLLIEKDLIDTCAWRIRNLLIASIS
jgi:nitrile hydratase